MRNNREGQLKEYTVNGGKKSICCSKCAKCFTTVSHFKRHNKKFHLFAKPKKPPKSYNCKVCNKAFVKASKLNRHMGTHNRPVLSCPGCSKIYTRTDHFNAHTSICTSENNFEPVTSAVNISDSIYDYSMLHSVTAEETTDVQFSDSDDSVFVTDFSINDAHSATFIPNTEDYDNVVEPEPSSASTIKRKAKNLSNVLETIQRLQVKDQANIIRRASSNSNIECLETVFMSDVESLNEAKLLNGLLGHLRNLNLMKGKDKEQFCSLLWSA